MSCYIKNVKNSIFRNLIFQLRSTGEFRSIAKDKFLNDVIAYCEKLRADPEQPKKKRVRIRNGRRIKTQ